MNKYRVEVVQYGDIKLELKFTTWVEVTNFIQATLCTTTEYVTFRLETFEE